MRPTLTHCRLRRFDRLPLIAPHGIAVGIDTSGAWGESFAFCVVNELLAPPRRASLLLLLLAMLALLVNVQAARAGEAQAASGTYGITVLLSSNEDQCYMSGNNSAIRDFVKRRVKELNSSGQLNGRTLSVDFRDDFQNAQTSIVNVRAAIRDSQTLALIGMPGWRRAADVFKDIGKEIGDSKIPFLPTSPSTRSSRTSPTSSPCAPRRKTSACR